MSIVCVFQKNCGYICPYHLPTIGMIYIHMVPCECHILENLRIGFNQLFNCREKIISVQRKEKKNPFDFK